MYKLNLNIYSSIYKSNCKSLFKKNKLKMLITKFFFPSAEYNFFYFPFIDSRKSIKKVKKKIGKSIKSTWLVQLMLCFFLWKEKYTLKKSLPLFSYFNKNFYHFHYKNKVYELIIYLLFQKHYFVLPFFYKADQSNQY